MRHFFLVLVLLGCCSALLPGCAPKEDLVQTSGSLDFGQDTVLFDTVFTTVRTVTKRLWVYNRNRGAVKTDVSLAKAGASPYSLVVSGDAGPGASGVTIRGNDSLLVLVRATVGDNGAATAAKEFVVADQINFLTNGNAQDVKLVAYGQNAYFERGLITQNTTWKTDKPHVIANGVAVAPGVTLRIPKGARIYSHAGAQLQVQGTLLVNDLSEPDAFLPTDTVKDADANIVRFGGDRLEPFYTDIPGQWGGIVFTATSRGNRIRYAEIKNATYGLVLLNPDGGPRQPDVAVDNTIIKNISGASASFASTVQSLVSLDTGGGIVSLSGDVKATNCLLTNCGEYAILGYGGTYDLNFCTVANYTPSFQRKSGALTFTDKSAVPGIAALSSPQITIRNSIVWGSLPDELLLDGVDAYRNGLVVRNSVLRTASYAGTVFATPKQPGLNDAGLNNLVNVDPRFLRSPANAGGRYDYTLQDDSPALKLRSSLPPVPPRDLRNLPRGAPTVGAYEHK